ncbi:hypothetical protein N9H93_04650 [Rhizobiaceae bacterium]|nr:hypothetical protein [Rhizobiaceae bacterium]
MAALEHHLGKTRRRSSNRIAHPVTFDDLPSGRQAQLDTLQRDAFGYFLDHTSPSTGMVADSSREGSPCSIACIGFALTCYPIAVSRGWMTREDAAKSTLATLRFLAQSEQSEAVDASGYRGLYYHFLDMESGKRVWECELSLIDTTLMVAGVLTAVAWFDGADPAETKIRTTGTALYERIEWNWARDDSQTLAQGWTPENGFIRYAWEGYSEALLLYALAAGSPSHRLPENGFSGWTATYQWERQYGQDVLYAGPLFIHLFSHAWMDTRGVTDPYMTERGTDYFANTQAAIAIQRAYAEHNPRNFMGYGPLSWGITACDGPDGQRDTKDGRTIRAFGYSARGVPFGPDDGTLCPWLALAALPYAPADCLDALDHTLATWPDTLVGGRFPGSFNPSIPGDDGAPCWRSNAVYGLDQGLIVIMVENFRTGMIWDLWRRIPALREGLSRMGFTGGWLA